ncbi:hypothetical protein ACPCKW_32920 [Streptomyces griseoincarnatus]
MNLEGIGAIAAAAVACTAVPASIYVGRRQAEAALRGAEATYKGGLAQAESAYAAALDAVRAETEAADRHWLRGLRRDAYAAFLLASHTLTEQAQSYSVAPASAEASALVSQFSAELRGAETSLRGAYLITALEGGETLEAISFRVMQATIAFGRLHERGAMMDQAWANLTALSSKPTEESIRRHATRLLTSLANLTMAVLERYPDRELRLPVPDMPESITEAVCNCQTDFLNLQDVISEEDRRLLLEIQYRGFIRERNEYADTRADLDTARDEFITAVRSELARI